ncbi:MAG: TlpA disulfide reductase family protein [Bacteroidota bacterium]
MSRKWVYALGLIVVALIALFYYNKYAVAPAIDFNKVNLVDLHEQPVKFDSFKGKKTIVCFSASWCPNCLNELRELNAIKDSQLQGVEIVVISDEPLDKILDFSERTAYPFTFLKLEQAFSQVGINSIPTTYLVNSRLEIKKETVGYIDWSDPSTCEHLKKLMD